MISAKCCIELVELTEWLVEELAVTGLHLNSSKTKLLCTSEGIFDCLDIGDTLVKVLAGDKCHNYFCKTVTGISPK